MDKLVSCGMLIAFATVIPSLSGCGDGGGIGASTTGATSSGTAAPSATPGDTSSSTQSVEISGGDGDNQ